MSVCSCNKKCNSLTDKDIEHLYWMYGRMKNVHNENVNTDYMLRFMEIINYIKGLIMKPTEGPDIDK